MRHFSCIKDLKQTGCGREEQQAQALPPESFWGFGKVRGELSGKEDRMRKNYRTLVSVVAAAAMFLSTGMPISAVNAETVDMAQDTDPESRVLEETKQDGTSQNETPQDQGTAEAAESAGSEAQAEEGGTASTENLASAESSSAAPEQAGEESAEAAPGEGSTAEESVSAESTETSTESTTQAPSESSTGALSEATTEASVEETTGTAAEETTGTTEEATEETTDGDFSDLPTEEELDAQIKEEEDALEIKDETAAVTGTAKSNDTVIVGYAGFSLEEGSLSEQAPDIDGYTFNGGITLDGVEVSKIFSEVETTDEERTYSVRVGEDDKVQEETVTRDVVTEKTKVTKAETANGVITISGDSSVVFTYDEDHTTTTLTAEYVDAFGDPIDADQESVSVPFAEGKDEITLKESFPEKLQVAQDESGKKVKEYTFESTYIRENDEKVYVTAVRRVKTGDGYAYEVKKDGSDDYTELSGDTTLYVQYSDGQKAQYTYSDVNVTVTATLQHAGAIPDDARFIVTQVTPATDGYNYDAYMDALNGSEEDAAYDESNTLLYDIAFLGYAMDADGSIDTSKTIEYQPAEGSVKIDIQFHKNQLSGTLGADEDSDVTVTHLPLKDEVKAESDTTKDATAISADDVEVESIENTQTSTDENKVSFEAAAFSTYSITVQKTQKVDVNPGEAISLRSVLGESWNYGITANVWTQAEAETNFAVGTMKAGGAQTGITTNMIGMSYKDKGYVSGCLLGELNEEVKIKGYPSVITTTPEAAKNLHNSLDDNQDLILVYDTKENIQSRVKGMIDHVQQESNELAKHDSITDYSKVLGAENAGHYYLDFTEAGAGTIYIDVDKCTQNNGYGTLKYSLSKQKMVHLIKNDNQTIVFNYSGTDVTIGGLEIVNENYKKITDSDDLQNYHDNTFAETCNVASTIIYNMPNAKTVTIGNGSSSLGTYLCPQANATIDSSSCGWIVADHVTNKGEFHFFNVNLDKITVHENSVDLAATKQIDGQVPGNESFIFTLERVTSDAPMPDGSVAGKKTALNVKGNIDFGSITFDKNLFKDSDETEKSYIYKIYEKTEQDLTGYTIDKTVYYAKVTAKHIVRMVGQNYIADVTAEVSYYKDESCKDEVDSVTFNNKTVTKPAEKSGSIELTATKKLTGRDEKLKDNEFSFEVKEGDSVVARGTNKADGSITFSEITYTEAGEHTYTVRETKGTEADVSYDTHTYEVRVNVTEEGNELKAVATYPKGGVVFKNTYKKPAPKSTSIQLMATKQLTGKDLTKGEFTFTAEENGRKVAEGTNAADGSIIFSEIPYTEAGEHTYTVRETKGTEAGISYDTHTYEVRVNVTEEGNELKAAATYPEGGVVFKNTYEKPAPKSTSIQLMATKQLTGKDLTKGEFTFTAEENGRKVAEGTNAADGSIIFSEIPYTEAGEHTYTVRETKGTEAGVSYDTHTYEVRVRVTEEGNELKAAATYPEGGVVFKNTYEKPAPKSTSIRLMATKQLIGKDLTKGEFTFTAEENGRKVAEGTNAADGSITFSEIPYTEVGEHTYTVRETKGTETGVSYDTHTYEVRVNVTEEGNELKAVATYPEGGVVFKNTYEKPAPKSTSIQLTATKQLTGKDLTKGEFTFTAEENGRKVAEGTNAADGSITFSEIPYTEAGEHTYTVRETKGTEASVSYDTHTYEVRVRVTEEGNELKAVATYPEGGVVFKNTYEKPNKPDTPDQPTPDKPDQPTPDKPDQPTPDKPDQPTPDKPDQPTPDKPDQPTPDKPDQPTPDKPDQPTPDKPDQPTPDKPDQPTPDKPDQPTPDKPDTPTPDTPSTPDTPTAKSGSVTLTATKQLIGADLEAGDFSFEVTEDGNVVATGTNDASGLIQFSTISYTAVGEHDYSVYEDTGSLPNVTYDTTVYSVHVSVVDEGSDTLTVKVAGADNMVFTNTYNGNHPNGDTPDNGSDSSNGGGGKDTGNTPHNDGTNDFFEEDESDNQTDQLIFEDEDANESDHETEETSEDSDMNVPQTGDDSNLMIWFVLIAMAVMGITGSSIYRKKKDERQNEQ